jgi:hypothetical protein
MKRLGYVHAASDAPVLAAQPVAVVLGAHVARASEGLMFVVT